MDILIRNGLVITCTETGFFQQQAHLCLRSGVIDKVLDADAPVDPGSFGRVIDASGKVVLPGLVNAHTHSYANLTKGLPDTIPLEPWMLYITAAGRLYDPEDVYWSTLLGIAEMLASGTTACLDHLAQPEEGLEAALEAFDLAGMRVGMAPMISDKPYLESLPLEPGTLPEDARLDEPPSPGMTPIDTTRRLLEKWHGRRGRIHVLVGPSGPQRCSDEFLRRCGDLAREYGTGLHSHLLETKVQARTGLRLYGRPMVLHLDRLGLLDHKSSFAHGVWLTEDEMRVAADRGVVIVHNPASNLRLGSGTAPVRDFRRLGVRVALGTDGANSGGNVNLFESIKLAAMLHNPMEPDPGKWIQPQDVLRMATVEGAAALGQSHAIGVLAEGRRADLVILDPARSTALVPMEAPLRQLVHGETGAGVDTVLVDGKVVVENGRVATFDVDRVRAEVDRRARRVAEQIAPLRAKLDSQAGFIRGCLGCGGR